MLEDKLKYIADTPLGMSMNGKYSNSLSLNGFILQEPKFVRGAKSLSGSFIIYQVNKTPNGEYLSKSYAIITYIPSVIEKLRKVKNVCFVNCLCKLEWQPKIKSYVVVMWDFDLSCELDIKLEAQYQKGVNQWNGGR